LRKGNGVVKLGWRSQTLGQVDRRTASNTIHAVFGLLLHIRHSPGIDVALNILVNVVYMAFGIPFLLHARDGISATTSWANLRFYDRRPCYVDHTPGTAAIIAIESRKIRHKLSPTET